MVQTVPHIGPLAGPWCQKCNKQMTPENSRVRPELFYCDKCLDRHLPEILKSEVREDTCTPPVVDGLVLVVKGGDIISHCRAKAQVYVDLENIRRKKAAKWADERRERQELRKLVAKDSPAPRSFESVAEAEDAEITTYPATWVDAPPFGFLVSYEVKTRFFTCLADGLDPNALYRLSLVDLDRLEWFY